MKKIILSLLTAFTLAGSTFGQAPEGFKYQAVVRNSSNVVLNNQTVGMQIEILQGGIAGSAIYTESFASTTNGYGLVDLEIGTGSTTDDFSTIDWGNDSFFIRTSIDVTGGSSYVVMGTSQLMSVPYALHSKTAETVLNDLVDDADADPANEIQDLQLIGNILTITNNGTATSIDLSMYLDNTDTQLDETAVDAMVANNGYLTTEIDGSVTNEIQDLQLVGNTLTITNNGSATSIDLSGYLDNTDTQLDSTDIAALGYVAGSHKIIDYEVLAAPYPTGRTWIDGKMIMQTTFVKMNPFANWYVLSGSIVETLVDFELMVISDVPANPTKSFGTTYGRVSQEPTGEIVVYPINGTSTIQAGSRITLYYTQP